MRGWPLGTLLVLAERDEVAARAALAAAIESEAERQGAREAAAEAVAAARAALALAGGSPLRPARAADVRDAARHLSRLGREAARAAEGLRASGAAVDAARREVDARKEALAAARRAARTLEGHRDRWSAAASRAAGRAEDAAADDLVSARPAAWW